MDRGVDIFRFNFSHGNNHEKAEQIECIRFLSEKQNKIIGVLADLQGYFARMAPEGAGRFSETHGQCRIENGQPAAIVISGGHQQTISVGRGK